MTPWSCGLTRQIIVLSFWRLARAEGSNPANSDFFSLLPTLTSTNKKETGLHLIPWRICWLNHKLVVFFPNFCLFSCFFPVLSCFSIFNCKEMLKCHKRWSENGVQSTCWLIKIHNREESLRGAEWFVLLFNKWNDLRSKKHVYLLCS